MKNVIFLAIGCSLLVGCATSEPVRPAPAGSLADVSERQTLTSRCNDEAVWPSYHSKEYASASVRQREQMTNDPSPDELDIQFLCGRMKRATDDNAATLASDCQKLLMERRQLYGAPVADNVARLAGICQSLTGMPVSVPSLSPPAGR